MIDQTRTASAKPRREPRRSTMMPASGARAYASAVHGRFVELDAGHFALLLRRETATVAITDFLSTL